MTTRDRGLADRPSGDMPGEDLEPAGQGWLMTTPAGAPRWEYLTTFVEADARTQADYLTKRLGMTGSAKYTPEAMMPNLTALGGAGWELMHIEPVEVGNNRDIKVFPSSGSATVWTHTYFCVFKRPRRGS